MDRLLIKISQISRVDISIVCKKKFLSLQRVQLMPPVDFLCEVELVQEANELSRFEVCLLESLSKFLR